MESSKSLLSVPMRVPQENQSAGAHVRHNTSEEEPRSRWLHERFTKLSPLPPFVMIERPHHEHEEGHPNLSDLQQVLVFLAELHRLSASAKQVA